MNARQNETGDGRDATKDQIVDARALLGTRREILLDLDGQVYRLRLTASGKLILTK